MASPPTVPLSVSLAPDHVVWLDQQQQATGLSRSAVLRLALSCAIAQGIAITPPQLCEQPTAQRRRGQ